jgi:hypothetical protein
MPALRLGAQLKSTEDSMLARAEAGKAEESQEMDTAPFGQ